MSGSFIVDGEGFRRMLCHSCGTKRITPVQECTGDINMLHYYCSLCDVHQIVIEHGNSKNSVLGTLRAVNYIRKALEGTGWKLGGIQQPNYTGDDQWL